jgi:hypothetical protein
LWDTSRNCYLRYSASNCRNPLQTLNRPKNNEISFQITPHLSRVRPSQRNAAQVLIARGYTTRLQMKRDNTICRAAPCSVTANSLPLRGRLASGFTPHTMPLSSITLGYDVLTALTLQVRVRVTLRLTVSQSVCLGVEPNLGQFTGVCFLLEISFRQLQVCNFVAPSLTRGRVCKLLYNCFRGLARTVTLRSKYRRTHGLILKTEFLIYI